MKDFFKPEDFATRKKYREAKQLQRFKIINEIMRSKNWARYPHIDGIYVSKDGRVFSSISAKERKQYKTNSGYLCVHAEYGKNKTVHSMVLETWSGPRPKDFEASHLNGIKTDNRLSNLKWCSRSENQFHRVAHGTDNRGEKHPLAILSKKDFPAILRLIERGKTQKEVGEIFGVCTGSINSFLKGRSWKNI